LLNKLEKHDISISFEFPNSSKYWTHPRLQAFVQARAPFRSVVHACAMGIEGLLGPSRKLSGLCRAQRNLVNVLRSVFIVLVTFMHHSLFLTFSCQRNTPGSLPGFLCECSHYFHSGDWSVETMLILSPDLPLWKRESAAFWLETASHVKDRRYQVFNSSFTVSSARAQSFSEDIERMFSVDFQSAKVSIRHREDDPWTFGFLDFPWWTVFGMFVDCLEWISAWAWLDFRSHLCVCGQVAQAMAAWEMEELYWLLLVAYILGYYLVSFWHCVCQAAKAAIQLQEIRIRPKSLSMRRLEMLSTGL